MAPASNMDLPSKTSEPQGFVAESTGDVTRQLLAWNEGDRAAFLGAFAAVHESLHALAHQALARERASHTLGTAGLLGEAFLRLLEQPRARWRSREHFLAIAAQMIRRILVDYSRGRRSLKRGGGNEIVPLLFDVAAPAESLGDLLAIHEALEALANIDARQSEIVELRFFAGLSHDEIASYLGVSAPTIERRWRLARAWLFRELGGAS